METLLVVPPVSKAITFSNPARDPMYPADITYPPELFDHPWMRPVYGDPDYIVRDLYREENGWWDRNPTTLHPASPTGSGDA